MGRRLSMRLKKKNQQCFDVADGKENSSCQHVTIDSGCKTPVPHPSTQSDPASPTQLCRSFSQIIIKDKQPTLLGPSSKSVRFDSVHVREYKRTLGDFHCSPRKLKSEPYCLSLDWEVSDACTVPIDDFESSRTNAFSCPVQYALEGRIEPPRRCHILGQTMETRELAELLAFRRGRTTARAVTGMQVKLQNFLAGVSPAPP